jgi:hypothetical protein
MIIVQCPIWSRTNIRGLLLTRKLLNQGLLLVSWSHHFESFTVATMTWLTATEYLRHKWPRICSTCRKHFFRSFPRTCFIAGFVTRLTRRVPLVKQELLTLPEHLRSPPIFNGVRVTRYLASYVCCVDHCLSFCTFSFGHCVFCSSSIYWFWLPLWYLKTLLIKILPQSSLEFSCYSICLSYTMLHWRYFVYLWWFLQLQLNCKIS